MLFQSGMVTLMVILFSERKSNIADEITEILTSCGANYISDRVIYSPNGSFTVVREYKKTDITLKKGVAVFCDNTERFKEQSFPLGIIGICEDRNKNALKVFLKSKTPVISCGLGNKNTVTVSSITDNSLLATLQRSINTLYGVKIEPADFKIALKKNYSTFSVMASVAVLLLNGINPKEL